ncbi:metacaspase-9-like [Magnolia sinica]|uniref:metacaspase-9-like n=1 Tax=Magnolia sinica TaxID=86752 RepID=UPI00265B41B9|nr:metacaspase-9-like [Magnolia sinica]
MARVKKSAVLVGCNYANTRNELHGCINDVLAMQATLIDRFGFETDDIKLLTDAPGSRIMPTGTNIKKVLGQMIDGAGPGDILFFHYSGHGTLIPSHGHGPNKKDEAIVPCDFNLITDIDFRHLVNRLPKGASFTIFSDSCHSGGLIDKEKEQIGPHVHDHGPHTNSGSHHRPKTIPFDSILNHLTKISGIQSSDVGAHLSEVFGSDASAKFRSHSLQSGTSNRVGPDDGILISGCQTNETSADMDPNDDGSKAYGAFSNAVQTVLEDHKGVISNRELVTRVREVLHVQGFKQHPCLYCSDQNADATFLRQSTSSSV